MVLYSIIFLAGAMTGATVGVFMLSAVTLAKSADEEAEQALRLLGDYNKIIPSHGGVREQQRERQYDQ